MIKNTVNIQKESCLPNKDRPEANSFAMYWDVHTNTHRLYTSKKGPDRLRNVMFEAQFNSDAIRYEWILCNHFHDPIIQKTKKRKTTTYQIKQYE